MTSIRGRCSRVPSPAPGAMRALLAAEAAAEGRRGGAAANDHDGPGAVQADNAGDGAATGGGLAMGWASGTGQGGWSHGESGPPDGLSRTAKRVR
jgi:hypothetical protein